MAFAFALQPGCLRAWDGFDAATAGLVEVIPDRVPSRGDTVEVRTYATGQSVPCLIQVVTRNARTIELTVREANGRTRTLVMEGR